jgi:hypothetical protein
MTDPSGAGKNTANGGGRPDNSHGLCPGGYAQEMINSPTQLLKYLGGVDYPLDKETLI